MGHRAGHFSRAAHGLADSLAVAAGRPSAAAALAEELAAVQAAHMTKHVDAIGRLLYWGSSTAQTRATVMKLIARQCQCRVARGRRPSLRSFVTSRNRSSVAGGVNGAA